MRNPLSAIIQTADGILTSFDVEPFGKSHVPLPRLGNPGVLCVIFEMTELQRYYAKTSAPTQEGLLIACLHTNTIQK